MTKFKFNGFTSCPILVGRVAGRITKHIDGLAVKVIIPPDYNLINRNKDLARYRNVRHRVSGLESCCRIVCSDSSTAAVNCHSKRNP